MTTLQNVCLYIHLFGHIHNNKIDISRTTRNIPLMQNSFRCLFLYHFGNVREMRAERQVFCVLMCRIWRRIAHGEQLVQIYFAHRIYVGGIGVKAIRSRIDMISMGSLSSDA